MTRIHSLPTQLLSGADLLGRAGLVDEGREGELVGVSTKKLNELMAQTLDRLEYDQIIDFSDAWRRKPDQFQLWMMASESLGIATVKFMLLSGQGESGGFLKLSESEIIANFDSYLISPKVIGFSVYHTANLLNKVVPDPQVLTIELRLGFEWVGSALERMGMQVTYDANMNGIVARGDNILRLPLLTSNKVLESMLRPLELRPLLNEEDSVVSQAEQVIRTNICLPDLSLSTVADALCMSPRTLQRKLSDGGVTFGGLLESVRRKIIDQGLSSGLSKEKLREILGYEDVSSIYKLLAK